LTPYLLPTTRARVSKFSSTGNCVRRVGRKAIAGSLTILDQQAFMLSANDIFYVSAVVFVLLIAVVWLARPIKSGAAADAAASGAH
jgi:hypothetical protein